MVKEMMLAGGKTAPGVGHFETFEIEKPEIKNDTDVLFRVTSIGMCGTDVSIYKWTDTVAKEYHPQFPLVIGHEMSGIVEQVGSAVTKFKPGDHVAVNEHIFCGKCEQCKAGRTCICTDRAILGCHINGACTKYMVVRELNCFKVPDNVPTYAGSLAEPLSVAVHAVERCPVKPGDVAVVYGVGMIGLGVCLVLGKAGATVLAVGTPKDEKRMLIAKDLGAKTIISKDKEDVLQVLREMGKVDGADVAYDCSGAPAALQSAIEVIRPAGIVCEVGIPGQEIPIDVAGQLVFKEKQIIGTRAFYHSTWNKTMELMGESADLLDKFITHKLPLERFAEAIDLIKNGEAIRAIICPNDK